MENEKPKLQAPEDIVQSLINLRNELWLRKEGDLMEIFYKINSCLYSSYPKDPQ